MTAKKNSKVQEEETDTIDGTGCISVVGARVNNTKNVDVDIPHN